MKTIYILLIIVSITLNVSAQRIVEKTIPVTKNQKIELDFQFADDIIVNAWDKNEVYVKATVNINYGEDNDKFEFDIFEGSSFIKIESEIKDLKKISKKGYRIIIEDDDTIITNGCHTKMDLNFEIKMPAGCELTIETISGNIEIKGVHKEMEINTISGDIDLSIPEDMKADLSMSTISGTLYSNLEVEFTDKHSRMHHIGGNIDTELNGGGVDIDLETISGNIYLRKTE